LLQRLSKKANRSFRLTREALDYLTQHDFPGNVRELRNMLQVAVAHSLHNPSGMITRERLQSAGRSQEAAAGLAAPAANAQPDRGASANAQNPGPGPADAPSVRWTLSSIAPPSLGRTPSLQDLEAHHIADLLQRFEGNRRRMAESLGVSERTLYRKLNRYNLKDLQW
jgi:DNA-binding NtrC family response regulator